MHDQSVNIRSRPVRTNPAYGHRDPSVFGAASFENVAEWLFHKEVVFHITPWEKPPILTAMIAPALMFSSTDSGMSFRGRSSTLLSMSLSKFANL